MLKVGNLGAQFSVDQIHIKLLFHCLKCASVLFLQACIFALGHHCSDYSCCVDQIDVIPLFHSCKFASQTHCYTVGSVIISVVQCI